MVCCVGPAGQNIHLEIAQNQAYKGGSCINKITSQNIEVVLIHIRTAFIFRQSDYFTESSGLDGPMRGLTSISITYRRDYIDHTDKRHIKSAKRRPQNNR